MQPRNQRSTILKRGGSKIKFKYSVPPQNPPLKDLRNRCKHLVLVSMKIFKDTRVGKTEMITELSFRNWSKQLSEFPIFSSVPSAGDGSCWFSRQPVDWIPACDIRRLSSNLTLTRPSRGGSVDPDGLGRDLVCQPGTKKAVTCNLVHAVRG